MVSRFDGRRDDRDPRVTDVSWIAVAMTGLGMGFLGGLFGKGGSAIATPMLHALGVPAIVAVAAPLPATIPSTMVASVPYYRERLVDRDVLAWSLVYGVPATIIGAVVTRWVSGDALIVLTDLVILGLGLRFLIMPADPEIPLAPVAHRRLRLAGVGIVVGFASGLLANSGGFLLAPLYIVVLRLPIKAAFASSLAVAAVLALPGTLVHWSLGHIDWAVVATFGVTSIPFSYLGARVALRSHPRLLERAFGAVLVGLSIFFLLHR